MKEHLKWINMKLFINNNYLLIIYFSLVKKKKSKDNYYFEIICSVHQYLSLYFNTIK